ncbi:SDR family NAD(P)-dependent oxidoreductase [Nocardia sp. CDC159]|uniref:SDR family NAD(P)-dependent oxidoreductase n=2 Tax=Nocardiaceae TaxID=85025 RepID=A0A9X2E2W0_9NOCA|nr:MULTISPECIES: SDR family NAD(P)-dependent oxidoreductase [Nocardia]MCM6773132.1 SDR family NAD(P)-dependent oxidoreductase [Nocardia pulmonis]MCM6785565.1 SDR family NAD(P)-dependent oxidoreductase [Nocardia sp. CDC159]
MHILITGASSGIGRAAALELAGRGARLILVARREPELRLVHKQIAELGGDAEYHATDLSLPEQVDGLVERLGADGARVDVLVNNAGRSIRRPVTESLDRAHDYERTMAINYFGAVRLTLGLLPGMLAHGSGHIVNIGTWGVGFETSPYFSAYLSSKAALIAFGRCLDAELGGRGIHTTAVNFPSVRTAMLAPTAQYARMPALTPEEAANWIVTAIRTRPVRIEPYAVHAVRLVSLFSPRAAARLLLRAGM